MNGMNESRLTKSLLNARVNLVFYVLTLTLSFFSRRIFLNCLGSDFVGLSGTLLNLMGFLNLAELGIGTAIGYVLYKPLFEHDHHKINELISVFGYIYRWIGMVILAGGIVLACFLPLIFPNTGFSYRVIYFVYISFLASSLIGYFINYKQTLLGADQRNYVITGYFQTFNIIKILVQMVSAWYTGNYYLWSLIEIIFGIAYSVVLNRKIGQVYPWLNSSIGEGKRLFRKYPEVIKYTKQLFAHRMGTFVQYQTTPFLIYAFVSLQTVAYYGNYTIITDKISVLVNNLLGSTGAGVGNLIAEGDKKKIQTVFWELFSLRMLIAGSVCFALYHLIEPFISLWLGKEYVLPQEIVFLVVLNMFICITRGATDQFLYGYGLFWDVWVPVVESILTLLVAVIGGYFWGLPGILMGGITGLVLVVGIWKPLMLFHWGFKQNVLQYWVQFGWQCILIGVPGMLLYPLWRCFSAYAGNSFLNWVLYACLVVSSYSVPTAGLMYGCTNGMRGIVKRILAKLNKRHR